MTLRYSIATRTVRRIVLAAVGLAAAAGCNSPLIRSQSPELGEVAAEGEKQTRLIAELTAPLGMNYERVDGVALVTGLNGAGGDAPPSPERSALIAEMQSHNVKNPNQVLASADTSLVLVHGYLPPGVQKGDRFDVEVEVPPRSGTSSLRDGWLMPTRLRKKRVVDNTVLSGHVESLAQGPVLVDAVFQGGADGVLEKRGRVLGGGVAQKPHQLGLAVLDQYSSVRTSAAIGAAIQERFHIYDHGVKQGVAKPMDDNYIELRVHPRYKHNISRYMRVVGSIALSESASKRVRRLETLERMLLEPITAASAALQLEAIGQEGVPALKAGLLCKDPEVRFYAAEALAYLDEAAAAEPLTLAARERAFRWHALAALSAMDHVAAYDALASLLDDESNETRVGAFRALRARNPHDPKVRGETVRGRFAYHVVMTTGPDMIHFAGSQRAEIVLFGHQQRLAPPNFLFAGKRIVVTGCAADQLKVSSFKPDEQDQCKVSSTRLDDLIRTVASLGGGYADIKQLVDEAKAGGHLASRVVVDALPEPGRPYHRDADNSDSPDAGSPTEVASPLPEMFSSWAAAPQPQTAREQPDGGDQGGASQQQDRSPAGFLGRMGKWFFD